MNRLDGNLFFDQSIFSKNKKQNRLSEPQKGKNKKKQKKKQDRRDSMASGISSEDSDMSEDAYLDLVSKKWGSKESELR